MNLPDPAQACVNQLRAILGIPPSSQLIVSVDAQGQLVYIEVKTIFRREKTLTTAGSVRPNGRASALLTQR